MITFEKSVLPNGLTLIVHRDETTPIVAVNLLYNVGAKDEHHERTGFAHLFEHLMFEGSLNIPRFDEPLQKVGGENNAFTNNDITNYYITLPKANLETALWLESDRMLGLALSQEKLDVQRNVVIEEFKQRYLNQPYGDVWLMLRPLAYQHHPYQWPTIGKEIKHIEEATLQDVSAFFRQYYRPDNAILVIAGDVDPQEVATLADKWFGSIPTGTAPLSRDIPQEPPQTIPRKMEVTRNVPSDAIYRAYHTVSRKDPRFHAVDLVSDILSRGHSSRLFNRVVKNNHLFTEIDAYVTGDMDPGLFVIAGKLAPGVDYETAERGLDAELDRLKTELVPEKELQKVKNKSESTLVFSEMNVLNKAMNLAYFELLGSASLIQSEVDRYLSVSSIDIQEAAASLFRKENCSTLYYKSKRENE